VGQGGVAPGWRISLFRVGPGRCPKQQELGVAHDGLNSWKDKAAAGSDGPINWLKFDIENFVGLVKVKSKDFASTADIC
jgi:hypothetical protein